jgi:glycosyltransferase involved in cell wall biosynthesis
MKPMGKRGNRRNRIGVSVVLIALTEERHLGPCLDTLQWADEIVVDSGSTDRTRDIARGYTEKAFTVP